MRFSNNKYILYTKDIPLLSFRCDRDSKENPVFTMEQEYNSLRPFHFEDIGSWIANRRAPKHRTHIKELLERCGCNDLEGFIRFAYCAGLNDTFWVRPEEMDLSWDAISLYKNEFDENIARLAFGTGLMGEEFTSTTPELATDGTFPKCWKRFGNEIYLLKQGSSGAVNAGREPYSELYAYELSREICDNPLPYDLIRYHKELVSRCKLFTSEDIGYTPAVSFFNRQTSLDEMISFFDGLGSGKEFRQMVVLDALTLNTDRHLKNFGIVYDNDTMEPIKMAPVFDNNLSLCPFAEMEDLRNIDAYMATRQCALGEGFNESAIRCLTPELKDKLYQLRNFKFHRHSGMTLPEERLVLLENLIHKQAENLLQEKVINIPLDFSEEISLDGFVITLSKEDIPENLLINLKSGRLRFCDFNLYTQPGDKIAISNCAYTVNEYGNRFEIDVYDCKTSGNSAVLIIKDIDGLKLMLDDSNDRSDVSDSNIYSLTAEAIEVQLDKGSESRLTTLANVCLELEH